MGKIIIMKGLPASGKSTKAKEIIKETGNTIRLNKDLLREMLHFNEFNFKNEKITKEIEERIAWLLLENEKNINVVIDDTNLNEKTFKRWKDIAEYTRSKCEVIDMETSMEECIKRDKERELRGERFVGESVIVNMALSTGLYPTPKQGFILCDIDGTISDCEHRRHFVAQEPKDWKNFLLDSEIEKDVPIQKTVQMLLGFEAEGYDIIFVSARNERHRKVTEKWLLDKCFNGRRVFETILFRRDDDHRPDTEVKKDILDKNFKDRSLIKAVIDDRPSVIKMWRDNGLEVIEVGDGIDF